MWQLILSQMSATLLIVEDAFALVLNHLHYTR